MRVRSILYRATILLGLAAGSTPAAALTGGDLLDRMSSEQRFGYLGGAVEMAAFLSATQGDTERGNCIMGWFYDKDGTTELANALSRFRDKEALPVVQALIERACGE
jgi:hypothetical protein